MSVGRIPPGLPSRSRATRINRAVRSRFDGSRSWRSSSPTAGRIGAQPHGGESTGTGSTDGPSPPDRTAPHHPVTEPTGVRRPRARVSSESQGRCSARASRETGRSGPASRRPIVPCSRAASRPARRRISPPSCTDCRATGSVGRSPRSRLSSIGGSSTRRHCEPLSLRQRRGRRAELAPPSTIAAELAAAPHTSSIRPRPEFPQRAEDLLPSARANETAPDLLRAPSRFSDSARVPRRPARDCRVSIRGWRLLSGPSSGS